MCQLLEAFTIVLIVHIACGGDAYCMVPGQTVGDLYSYPRPPTGPAVNNDAAAARPAAAVHGQADHMQDNNVIVDVVVDVPVPGRVAADRRRQRRIMVGLLGVVAVMVVAAVVVIVRRPHMIPVDIVMIPTASSSPDPDGNGTESVGSLTGGGDSE